MLCDIVDPNGWGPPEDAKIVPHAGARGYPGAEVMNETELPHMIARQLARLNDHGHTFEEIAGQLEKATDEELR